MPDGEERAAGLRLAVRARRVGDDVADGDAEVAAGGDDGLDVGSPRHRTAGAVDPPPTAPPIASLPITNIGTSGPPRLMASGLPYFANAGPMPIFCASFENAVSASARLLRYCSIERRVGRRRHQFRRQHIRHRRQRRHGLGLAALVGEHAPAGRLLLPVGEVLERRLLAVGACAGS